MRVAGWVVVCAVSLLQVGASAAAVTGRASGEWTVENRCLRVSIEPAGGRISVVDRRCGYTWRQGAIDDLGGRAGFRDVRKASDGSGVEFVARTGWNKDSMNDVRVKVELIGERAEMAVSLDLADHNAPVNLPSLDPFVLDTPEGVLAVTDACDGHLYPTDLPDLPGHADGMRNLTWFPADRLDMPWVGLCDMKTGVGAAMILDTPDDALLTCAQYEVGGRKLWAPRMVWLESKGAFSYARRLVYSFTSDGGYVALAKAYRAYAKTKGLIVPFSEKAKINPHVRDLYGAPSVWGFQSPSMAKEMRAAGIERALIQRHGDWIQKRSSPEEIKAINDLGFLTGEYDNFVDIYAAREGDQPASSRGRIPDDAVQMADGQRMKGWWDGTQYCYTRCPALYAPTVDAVLPDLLKQYPLTARFLDVAAAQDLYECYDPKHPMTKTQDRERSAAMFDAARKHGLVVGGEHGIWWAVPYVDYFEGMMSGGSMSWSAGYLIHPKSKDDMVPQAPGEKLPQWSEYQKWGIGPDFRAPLWELVFHDCVATTWYWGDSNDWLLDADPTNAAKKDAFNILYGTMPMLWTSGGGSWEKNRPAFLRTYRNVCKLREAIADKEMLAHEFVTPDRSVQRTRFSDGTQVVVNFGEKPYEVKLGSRKYSLPQNGFAAKGPKIEQSLSLINGKPVTTVRANGYLFTDSQGTGITLRRVNASTVRAHIDGPIDRATALRLSDVSESCGCGGVKAFELDLDQKRMREAPCVRRRDGSVKVGPFAKSVVLELVGGRR